MRRWMVGRIRRGRGRLRMSESRLFQPPGLKEGKEERALSSHEADF